MTRLLILPLLFVVACKDGADDGDTDTTATDETDATSSDDEGTDDEGTDDEGTDDEGTDDTDGDSDDDVSLAGAWSGSWSFTWQYTEQDLNHPGPGQLWNPRDNSCSGGTISLTVNEAGEITVSPFAPCSSSTLSGWTHTNIDADVSDDGTFAITGTALFGVLIRGGGTFSSGFGLPVTGSIVDGTMTISGSRSQNQMQPTENLSFLATLAPAAVAAEPQ